MTRPAARIHVTIAFADGTFKFVALHPTFAATSARQAEQLAVQAEGGCVQRGLTRLDAEGWTVTLSANAAAARYWGPKAVAARASV